MADYIIGVDLGQSSDYTAIIVLRRPGEDGVYRVDRQERTRGTSYVEIVDRVKAIISKLPGAVLVVDQTGVGAPVVDMFEKAKLSPIGVLIHGGDRATHENDTWRVPKRDLVAAIQVLLQNRRLQVARGPLRDILVRELLNFKVKINAETAHDSYSAWREGDHDDLVLSVALACWYAGQASPGNCGWGRSRLWGSPDARNRRMLNDYQHHGGPEPRHSGPSWGGDGAGEH